jgi:formylglycine-generating enzyme required for sulfatase activity
MLRSYLKALSLIIATLAFLPTISLAQTPPKTVAVLEFSGDKASGVTLQERQTLAQLARRDALRALPRTGWSVMTRDNMQALLPPGVDLANCSGDECIITTGRMMQADYIVTGNVSKLGTNLQVILQLYDVRNGRLVGSADSRGASMDAVVERLEKEVREMFTELGGGSSFGAGFSESREQGATRAGVTFALGPPRIIEIISDPPGAVVDLGDGSIFCSATPCSKALPQGAHMFRLRREQYDDTTLRINVTKNGQKETIRLRANFALLNVETNPTGITVKVGGREVGKTPLKDVQASAGPAVVELVHSCYADVRLTLNLQRGETRNIRESLKAREAGLSLRAEDEETGNEVVAEVWGDGQKLGETPFQGVVNVCLQRVELRSEERGTAELKPTLTEGRVFSEVVKIDGGPKGMVHIPSGCFDMTSTIALGLGKPPPHRVCVYAFRMDRTEVTQEAYLKAMGQNPSKFDRCPTCPVEHVNWQEAQNFCRKLGGRLPTEAEWEYAARAGTNTAYYWGDSMDDRYAWYSRNSGERTHNVGEKLQNSWGLHDMAGNVWEWVGDWNGENNDGKTTELNPQGPTSGQHRVLRGGSWLNYPEGLRIANRISFSPEVRGDYFGFRCVIPSLSPQNP